MAGKRTLHSGQKTGTVFVQTHLCHHKDQIKIKLLMGGTMLQVNRELDPEKNRAGGLCVFIVKGLVLRRRSKMELMMLFFLLAGTQSIGTLSHFVPGTIQKGLDPNTDSAGRASSV